MESIWCGQESGPNDFQTVLWRFVGGSAPLGKMSLGRGRARMASKAERTKAKTWYREWLLAKAEACEVGGY